MANKTDTQTQRFEVNGMTLVLDAGNGKLQALLAGKENWLDNQAAGGSLWRLHVVDAEGRRVDLDSSAGRYTASLDRGALALQWREVRDAATGAGPFAVTVTVAPHSGTAGATAWRIQVENGASAWTLWHVAFPMLAGTVGQGDGQDDRMFYPHGWGIQRQGWAEMEEIRRRSSRGWDFGMQFMGYTRGEETLYFAAHDPRLSPKEYWFRPETTPDGRRVHLALTLFPEGMTLPGNGFRQDFDTVVAAIPGDWFDAATLYGEWARSQPWACRPPPSASTAPRREREIHVWQVLQFPTKPADEWGTAMERLQRELGVRIGVHAYNWHEIPFDISYPDYFPARPEFRGLAQRLRQAGMLVMPYINGRLWDINARSWTEKKAERFAVKYSAERAEPRSLITYLEEYGSGQKLAPMCPATAFWRETVLDLCRRIVTELGCDGVYLDQIAAEKAEVCLDRGHGHLPGGGGYWLAGYRQLAADLRAAVGPEVMLTTECNWEGCVADYDLLLSWAWYSPRDIPLFPAVYAGLGQSFGTQFNTAEMTDNGGEVFAAKMARLFVWGAQLGWGDLTPLLEESRRDLLAFLAQLCRLRAEHSGVFAEGRLLRPPTLCGVAADCRVVCALWQAPDGGQKTLFVANPGRLAAKVTIRLPDAAGTTVELSLPALSVRAIGMNIGLHGD